MAKLTEAFGACRSLVGGNGGLRSTITATRGAEVGHGARRRIRRLSGHSTVLSAAASAVAGSTVATLQAVLRPLDACAAPLIARARPLQAHNCCLSSESSEGCATTASDAGAGLALAPWPRRRALPPPAPRPQHPPHHRSAPGLAPSTSCLAGVQPALQPFDCAGVGHHAAPARAAMPSSMPDQPPGCLSTWINMAAGATGPHVCLCMLPILQKNPRTGGSIELSH